MLPTLKLPKLTKKQYYWLLAGALAVVVAVVLLVLAFLPDPQPEASPESSSPAPKSVSKLEENPYGPEDFSYAGDYLQCTAGPSVLGLDISAYQEEVDWEQVAQAGFRFVMIRIGGRGYGQEGKLYEDAFAQSHYEGAKAAGLQVGAYFFSQAISVTEAQQEAAFALNLVRRWELDLPLVYDWEYINEEARTANVSKRTLTDCMAAFCRAVERSGYEAMIYFNPTLAKWHFYPEELSQYDFWLAWYTEEMDYPHKVDMWQYTESGAVPGIPGPVDINLYLP